MKYIIIFLVFFSFQSCFQRTAKDETYKLLGYGVDLIPSRFKLSLFRVSLEEVLKNTVNGFILPVYADLTKETNTLKNLAQTYKTTTTVQNLQNLQNQWKKSRNILKQAEVIAFGASRVPEKYTFAELPTYTEGKYYIEMDSFSTRTFTVFTRVKAIADGSEQMNLEKVKLLSIDKKGYAALEYLIFDNGTGSKDTTSINTANQSEVRKAFIAALAEDISYQARSLENFWKPSGKNFSSYFINGRLKSQTDYLQDALNGLVYSLTYMIDFKVGEPSGLRVKNKGVKNLSRMESIYSNYTFKDLENNLLGFEKMYNASYNITSLKSLSSYVANKNLKLDERVKDQIADLKSTLNSISSKNTNMTNAINNDFKSIETFFTQLKRLRVTMANEVIPATGVLSLPGDTDGD